MVKRELQNELGHQEISPGSFFALKEAFVIMDLDTVTVVVAGVRATLMPMGPSLGWPGKDTERENNHLNVTLKTSKNKSPLTRRIGL